MSDLFKQLYDVMKAMVSDATAGHGNHYEECEYCCHHSDHHDFCPIIKARNLIAQIDALPEMPGVLLFDKPLSEVDLEQLKAKWAAMTPEERKASYNLVPLGSFIADQQLLREEY